MTLDEKITLYALGALEGHERAEFERQLAASPELRAQVAEARATMTAFMLAVEPVAPSPELKRRVMTRIAAPPDATPAARTAGSFGLGDVWRYLFGGLAIAFAALSLVLGVGLINTQQQLIQLRTQNAQTLAQVQAVNAELAATRQRVAQLEREVAQAQDRLAQAQQRLATTQAEADRVQAELAAAQAEAAKARSELLIAQSELGVLTQQGVRIASIPAFKEDFKQGTINVFYAPDNTSALITVANLPPLSPDLTYQVWLIKGDQRLPSEIFNTASDGSGRLIVKSDEPFSAFDNVGITVEPAGGRPTPNPDGPIFLGPLG